MSADEIPLVVDLDGCLLLTDTLYENIAFCLRQNPLKFFGSLVRLKNGRAAFKNKLAAGFDFNPDLLPFNQDFLAFLRRQRDAGREIILCTGANESIARKIAANLDLFSDVMASGPAFNLTGPNKAHALTARFGKGNFDYAGNSMSDIPAWTQARHAIAAGASKKVLARLRQIKEPIKTFPKNSSLKYCLKIMRPHQWLKNILVFLPMIAGHRWGDAKIWIELALAFSAFSLCSSAVYIFNDLLDMDNDRCHPSKRSRPLAAGKLSVPLAASLMPLLLLAAFCMAVWAGTPFLGLLFGYFALTCAYSLVLKRLLMLDCIILAVLYTLRILGGGLATGITVSFWLLTFSIFLFLSLAFLKRYAELVLLEKTGLQTVAGRAYEIADLPLMRSFGIATACASILVLALYLNSPAVLVLYNAPDLLWCEIPVFAWWAGSIWMHAHRGKMTDDPVLFAMRNPASLAAGGIFSLIFIVATLC